MLAPSDDFLNGWYIPSSDANAAADRQFDAQMVDYRSSYFAGQTSRYLPRPSGVNALGSNADYHYGAEQQYFLMVERARGDDRDNMVVGQAVSRMVANVMQDGFNLDTHTGEEKLDADLKARWHEWASSSDACDLEGERTFDKIAEMLLRTRTVDGDVVVLPTNQGKLQVVESHHLRNPYAVRNSSQDLTGLIHGVEMRNGRRVAYHLTPDTIGFLQPKRYQTRRYAARDANGNRQVLHIYDPKRFSQRRGVTSFAPIVFPTKYHDDLQFANLVNAKRASFIAIVREYEARLVQAPGDRAGGSRSSDTRSDGSTMTSEAGGPGQVIRGEPGETIKPWSANIPSPQFFPHAKMLLGIIAINLDLPVMVLMLDASETNFNGYRGVIDQARQRFSQFQRDMIQQFHTPVYQWWVRRQLRDPVIARFARRSNIDVFSHSWTPNGWSYIQPVQDASADDLRVTRNLISQRRRAQERGLDYETLADEIIEDRALLVELALERADLINSQWPEASVDWRELAYGLQRGGVSLSLTGNIDGDEPSTAPSKDRSDDA